MNALAAAAPHYSAITISTDQIKSWGIVGAIIIVIAIALIVKIAKSMVSRTIWIVVGLALLFLMWQQHNSIEQSIKDCDPHVLFLHLKLSSADAVQRCQSILNPGG